MRTWEHLDDNLFIGVYQSAVHKKTFHEANTEYTLKSSDAEFDDKYNGSK